jgi:hypothetical protein
VCGLARAQFLGDVLAGCGVTVEAGDRDLQGLKTLGAALQRKLVGVGLGVMVMMMMKMMMMMIDNDN